MRVNKDTCSTLIEQRLEQIIRMNRETAQSRGHLVVSKD